MRDSREMKGIAKNEQSKATPKGKSGKQAFCRGRSGRI